MIESETGNQIQPGKADRIREMFAEIAPRYDLLNHLLSLNVDRRWRRFTIDQIADRLTRPGTVALDLCCGTADLTLELARYAPTIGLDFCRQMLVLGARKIEGFDRPLQLIEGDAMRVPAADETFEVVTIAFGLRNLESVEGGLAEIYRVLKPGGRVAVLDFSKPRIPVFRSIFELYFTQLVPRIGNAISGSRFAYQYLPDSVRRFPDQERLAGLMRAVGFCDTRYYNLFGGVAALHLGDKR
ncbi:MAG TPA: bifunctional demethylmenaquinone methyltransferase/2-methoxy-6-polyprenyl-1,4-benzoquinol methylase UbiE [Blastocatellia bacterium]|nr:bifunctional demethylmenaquinone methyltransferase/2-methoxy-6-polyprenyl-1,4-benzoquinol methylase UbiE [Blastocatellia bacterium]